MFVPNGQVIGWETPDGRFVKTDEPCCEDTPLSAHSARRYTADTREEAERAELSAREEAECLKSRPSWRAGLSRGRRRPASISGGRD
jgi:hypothetical protein